MATIKQKRVARRVVKALTEGETITGGEILRQEGYSEHQARRPAEILESVGVAEELTILGFSVDKAKEVVAVILGDDTQMAKDRLKASEIVFKVNKVGGYGGEVIASAPQTVNYQLFYQPNFQALLRDFEASAKKVIENVKAPEESGAQPAQA